MNRILVPIDFSEHAREALIYALTMARAHHAQIDILHVLEEPAFPSFYGAGALMLYGEKPDQASDAQVALRSLIESVQPEDIHINAHVENGHAADGIVAFAKNNDTDLIVIPTHGLTGLKHVLLGSVAERVVREASCPVLVLKSP